MRRRLLALALGLVVVLGVAGCAAASSPSPQPSPSAATIPAASFTGGTADARLSAPARATWNGGWCTRGPEDAWLAVNIGFPNGAEYFGLVVGRSAYTPEATRVAAGGGTFTASDAVITWQHAGSAANLAPAGLTVLVARDLSLGTFSGRLDDGTKVAGSFSC